MDPQIVTLLQTAREAAKNAYAPYSSFTVGAALLATDGTCYSACNVENASYGLTSCAERNAIYKAVSEGKRTFTALALAAPQCVTPCGACRQVLKEFVSTDIDIYMTTLEGTEIRSTTLSKLFPDAFNFDANEAKLR